MPKQPGKNAPEIPEKPRPTPEMPTYGTIPGRETTTPTGEPPGREIERKGPQKPESPRSPNTPAK